MEHIQTVRYFVFLQRGNNVESKIWAADQVFERIFGSKMKSQCTDILPIFLPYGVILSQPTARTLYIKNIVIKEIKTNKQGKQDLLRLAYNQVISFTEMPTFGDLKSGDSVFFTTPLPPPPPGNSMRPVLLPTVYKYGND